MYSANFPANSATFWSAVSHGTGTTYGTFYGNSPNASETARSQVIAVYSRLGYIIVVPTATLGASGTLTITARANGAATGCVIVLSAGSAAGYYSSTTQSIPLDQGTYISYQSVNSTGGAATIRVGVHLF